MTIRERIAAILLLNGAAALLVAAGLWAGAVAVLATAGVLMVGAGVLLGLDDGDRWQLVDPADLPDGGVR